LNSTIFVSKAKSARLAAMAKRRWRIAVARVVMVVVGRTIKTVRGRWTRQQANLEEQQGGQWEISF